MNKYISGFLKVILGIFLGGLAYDLFGYLGIIIILIIYLLIRTYRKNKRKKK